jgi:hypothetical protein
VQAAGGESRTLLDWAGKEAGNDHGQSFAPLVRDAETAGRETIFVESNGVNSLATVNGKPTPLLPKRPNW